LTLGPGNIIRNTAEGYSYSVTDKMGGGGQSETAIADGPTGRVLLKRFLGPRFPSDKVPTGIADKMLAACEAFSDRHAQIHRQLAEPIRGAGNVVLALDFFSDGGSFYKAYPFVENASPPEIAAGFEIVRTFISTFLGSLRAFEANNIVHGDLKPANVLIETAGVDGELRIAKIIDYDDAYFAKNPPPNPVGDAAYASPELRQYWRSPEDAAAPTCKSDLFSAALTIHELVYGSQPIFTGDHVGYADAVLNGDGLGAASEFGQLGDILDEMLQADPRDRPNLTEVTDRLDRINSDGFGRASAPPSPAEDTRSHADGRGPEPETRDFTGSGSDSPDEPSPRPRTGGGLTGRNYRPPRAGSTG
jgi:serine/threonine protein kinase